MTMQLANHVDLSAGREAAAAINAALSLFKASGIGYEHIDGARYMVAGAFIFWPVNGYWRTSDNSLSGYGARTLVNAILPRAAHAQP